MKSFLSFLGSGFGFGWAPLMPGTAGTVSGFVLLILSAFLWDMWGIVAFVVVAFVLSVLTLPAMTDIYGEDPPPFVLDEWLGIAIPYGLLWWEGLAFHPLWIGVVFAAFRFFDVSKVGGSKQVQEWPGWWGVTLDDVLAGIYSLFVVKILIFFSYTFF